MSYNLAICNRCGETYQRSIGHACADITKMFPSLQRITAEELLKRKEVMALIDKELELRKFDSSSITSTLIQIKEFLTYMWGEQ